MRESVIRQKKIKYRRQSRGHEYSRIAEVKNSLFFRLLLFSPDIATYLNRIEEEKRARQHGAGQDNRSFIAKYWMYIVPGK
jgi:hypothetical protein